MTDKNSGDHKPSNIDGKTGLELLRVTAKPKTQRVVFNPFFNRELSWLAFNDRVLEEAQDPEYPILDRLKFVSIVSSNLDEFFMIRVAGLEKKVRRNRNSREEDGLKTTDALAQIREWALAQKSRQGQVLRDILEKLKEKGLTLQLELNPATDIAIIERAAQLLPDVKVQTYTKVESLLNLDGGKIFVYVRFKTKFAILSLPDQTPRLLRLPPELSKNRDHFVLAEKLLCAGASHYFKEEAPLEVFPFKLIRDADFAIDPETDPEDLLDIVEEAVKSRQKQPVVRLELDQPQISDGAMIVANAFGLHTRSVYRYDMPLDLKILWKVYNTPGYEELKFSERVEESALWQRVPDLVKILKGVDVLLHHPYDSFETVVKMIEAAADDPGVVVIRQTLYRTGKDSPIAVALKRAAQKGKSVWVFVEIRARFDEAYNVQLVRELKKSGVKVLKGFADKKVHCKLTQILHREDDGALRSFVHVGTGNYNPSTAKLYTDLSLLTTNESFGRDAEKIFKAIAIGRFPRNLESFTTAPVQLHRKMLDRIRIEVKHAKAGKPARIIAKVNALVDTELIKALYTASQAGVKIDLIVRGVCVLKPGVPRLSENIRVISIVGKYLEHSRIYYFQNGEHPRMYLSSADWMPRNFHSRLEIAFPVYDADLRNFLKDVVLENYLRDNQKARALLPDGRWTRLQPANGEPPYKAQEMFEHLAEKNYNGTPLFSRFVLTKEKEATLSIPAAGPDLTSQEGPQ